MGRTATWGRCAALLAVAIGIGASGLVAAEPSRVLHPKTLAWWTFDGHLRDEVHGLELKNVPHESATTEAFYTSIQYLAEVPVLAIGDKTNWRAYYRWGTPNLTWGQMGDELDAPGPFTIEAYLKPRRDTWLLKRTRMYVLRKFRVERGGTLVAQWALEIRRHPGQEVRQGDLWAAATFEMPDGRRMVREVRADNAVRMGSWQRVAVVYDGKTLSILTGGKRTASAAGPGPGARLLRSGGKSQLKVSGLALLIDGAKPVLANRDRTTDYAGNIDEVRFSTAALGGEQLLPPVQAISTEPLPEPPKRTEYTSIARRHLDLLMKHATDTYGPVHSPLLCSSLDPTTGRMPRLTPPILAGMPQAAGNFREGCNLDFMRSTLTAMRALSGVTGDGRFADHADKAIRFWLANCPYPRSGVWPLGEHGFWNFVTDQPDWMQPHEPGAHLDYERYYEIAPEKVARYIDLMHKMHVFKYPYKGRELWFHGRHGSPKGQAHAKSGCGFARHSGLFARAWAFLYAKTKNPKYLRWAKDQLDLLWQLRESKTGLVPTQLFPLPGSKTGDGRTFPARIGAGTLPIWAALGFLDAADWLPDPADKELFRSRAKAIAMANFQRYYRWNGKAFGRTAWQWLGQGTTPGIHWLLMKYWERAGRPAALLAHMKNIANDIVANWRPTRNTDAGRYGWGMMFLVQVSNETGDGRYLAFARRMGDYAVANLVADNGLMVGSGYYRIYDRTYHVPKLTQALLALDHPKHAAVRALLRETIF